METIYENILLSQSFTFVIGSRKEEFIIHGAALARLSKSLNNLLNGPMREAKEQTVHWEDVDKKTFIRFGQWAYTRDYVPAEPDILMDGPYFAPDSASSEKDLSTKAAQDLPLYSLASFEKAHCRKPKSTCECGVPFTSSCGIECRSCGGYFQSGRCNSCSRFQLDTCSNCQEPVSKASRKKKLQAINLFNDSSIYPSPTTHFKPRRSQESCEDYSEIFLCHAKLYALADKYDITELRKLSLHKLYVSLKEFTIYPSRVGDITSVVRYAFENTLENDNLRKLLVDYCNCIVEDISETQDFKDVVAECPDFAYGLILKMTLRLD